MKTGRGKRIYETLCRAESLDAAVMALNECDLMAAAEYLSKLDPRGGIPAQVFGVVTARLNAGRRSELNGAEVRP